MLYICGMKTETLHGYLVELTGKFDKVRLLEPDWDGQGGMAPSDKSIWDAGLFVRHVVNRIKDSVDGLSLPEVNPGGYDGSIDVVWRSQNNVFLIVNFKGDGYGDFYCERNRLECGYGSFAIGDDGSICGAINECIDYMKPNE